MMDGKEIALMKAAALAGFVLSRRAAEPVNNYDWTTEAAKLADSLMESIRQVYAPAYMSDESGKTIRIK